MSKAQYSVTYVSKVHGYTCMKMEFKNPVFGLVIIKESRITENPAVYRLHAWCWKPGSLCAPRTPRAGLQTDAWASTDVCTLFPHLAFVSSLWASIVGSFDVTAGALLKLNEWRFPTFVVDI